METVLYAKNPKYVFVFSYLNDTMIIFTACMMNKEMRDFRRPQRFFTANILLP